MKCPILYVSLFIGTLHAFANTHKEYLTNDVSVPKEIINIIDTNITVLSLKDVKISKDGVSPITLNSLEFKVIDSILISFLKEYNKKGDSIHLDGYLRQYVPYSLNNDRIVFINCLSKNQVSDFPSWRKYFVSVDGGGKSFFSLKVNLTLKKCFEFWVNTPL